MDKKFKMIIAANILGVVVSTASVVAMLFTPLSFMPADFSPNESTTFMGLYIAARNVSLMLGFIWLVKNKMFSTMPFFLTVLASVQLMDSVIGIYYKNLGQIFGPVVLAAIHISTVLYLRRTEIR